MTCLATVYVVWGSTYLAIRVMVRSIPPLLGAGARFSLAAAILGSWIAFRRGTAALRTTRTEALNAAGVGLLILGGGIGLVTVAEQHISSALTALLVASIPLWVVLLRCAHGERVGRATVLAVAIGFGGLALLVLPQGTAGSSAGGAIALLLIAALSTAVGAFFSKLWRLPADPLVATVVEMAAAGAALLGAGLAFGELGELEPADVSGASFGAFGYLVVFGSVVAYSAFVWLLAHARVSLVATYAYVNPVIALGLGVWLLGEEITATMAVGASVIVVSVFAVARAETRPD